MKQHRYQSLGGHELVDFYTKPQHLFKHVHSLLLDSVKDSMAHFIKALY
jgi:hypothetical protein